MANSIDPAFERLVALEAEIRAALKEAPNEADTRLKVLDRFLFEILQWKHEQVSLASKVWLLQSARA
jgi:hypothetical protein